MKKILTLLFSIIVLTGLTVFAEPELTRNYDGVEVPVGSFIPVMALQDFSTAYSDSTNELKFVCYNSVYEFETVIIPKGTVFYGNIVKKNEPILGTNASMVVRITKIVFEDGFTIPMVGYIYSPNGNVIGGEMTEPAKYLKMPHMQKGIARHFVGVLKYVPGETRKMGEHVTVAAGTNLLVVLTQPLYITHTMEANYSY